MKLTSRRWNILYRSDPKNWTVEVLRECTLDELEALCRLMGVPYSGTKVLRIYRLLDMGNLRIELSRWGEYKSDDFLESHEKAHKIAEEIALKYNKKSLIKLAKRAKTFYSLPKRGIIIGLLQWRERCRMWGQKFDDEIRGIRVVQYVLPGFSK